MPDSRRLAISNPIHVTRGLGSWIAQPAPWHVSGRYNLFMSHRSRRIPTDLSLNRLAEARARLGEIPYDLTVSNPTACELPYPPDLLSDLAQPRSLVYAPDPRGPLPARLAVAAQYRRWNAAPDPDRIMLTASTSEAYSFLFRLLCNPGDAVLVPSPSYPLLEHLARLDAIDAPTYDLEIESGWRIDFSSLERDNPHVRAVVVVHPNNPTGSFVHPDDQERLVGVCREHNWALIADEVFLPYPLNGGPGQERSFAAVDECLCCALGGLSKSLGLPQLKLAWIVVTGPNELIAGAVDGLDYVADAYLSVSTPVALALPSLLTDGLAIQAAISDRCRSNLATLRGLVAEHETVTVASVGGGWSAVIRVPSVLGDEDLCLELLVERGVAVHPGSLFGFPGQGWLTISLLPPAEVFADGVRLLLDTIANTVTPHSDGDGESAP
jgi:alanine-synthesizing transaminase